MCYHFRYKKQKTLILWFLDFNYLYCMLKKAFFFFIVSLLVYGCFKDQNYSEVPEIEFIDFVQVGDSAKLSFSFQDGEGDIGLSDDQIIAPFNPDSKYYYNVYMVYYEKDDVNGWVVGKDINGDSIIFKNRIKPIYIGKPKGLKGKIIATIEPIFYNPFSTQSDTIKYKIQLIDRALHSSNWVESNEIIR